MEDLEVLIRQALESEGVKHSSVKVRVLVSDSGKMFLRASVRAPGKEEAHTEWQISTHTSHMASWAAKEIRRLHEGR